MNQDILVRQGIDLKKIKGVLTRQTEVLAAYLTGSWAQGMAQAGSDVDIAILFKDPARLRKNYSQIYLEYYGMLSEFVEKPGLKQELDLVFLQILSVTHQFHAISAGRLIYTADLGKTLDYEEQVYNAYADLKPQIDLITGEHLYAMAYV